jgi:hypothetical protein
MRLNLLKWLLVGICACLAACAIITVNVYFPEKAVKEAYKSLDDMLLKGAEKPPASDKTPETGKQPSDDKQPAGEPAVPVEKPQSRLIDGFSAFSFVGVAEAAETDGDALAVELASMPEVLKAYDEMNRRLPRLTTLLDSGAVGLSSQGLITVRDKAKIAAQDEGLINEENQSRKTIVASMAKAILKITKVKESKPALDQVMGKAAATYAETKRDAAKPGWWYQLPNGRWLQK